MRPIKSFSLSILVVCVVISTVAVSAGESSAPPVLSGGWRLNTELSESPARKLMESIQGQDGGGRGEGMGLGGGGMRGGGGNRRGGGGDAGGSRGAAGPRSGAGFSRDEPPLDGDGDSESENGRAAQGMEARRPPGTRAPKPSPEFQIEQDGENIAFRTSGNLRLLHADGQKRKKEGALGKQDVVTRFVKGSLVIESKGEQGGKRKETYTLREDRKLQIDFEMDSAGRVPALKFRLVYDAAVIEPRGRF